MSEPLTDRYRAILDALGNGKRDLSDYARVMAISEEAFGTRSHLGRLRNDLGNLSWRGLVEADPVDADRFRITPEGMDARG